eukprot:scaffold55521_cov60-Attheya_sp.AAC.1
MSTVDYSTVLTYEVPIAQNCRMVSGTTQHTKNERETKSHTMVSWSVAVLVITPPIVPNSFHMATKR